MTLTTSIYNVLLVEDSPDFCDLFHFYARQTRLKLDVAMRGDEALHLLSENQYGCILLDYMLPDCSGKQLVEQLKNDNSYLENKDCSIVVTSAVEIPYTLLTNLYQSGISLFLPKTFALKEMAEIVRHFCIATEAREKSKIPLLTS